MTKVTAGVLWLIALAVAVMFAVESDFSPAAYLFVGILLGASGVSLCKSAKRRQSPPKPRRREDFGEYGLSGDYWKQ